MINVIWDMETNDPDDFLTLLLLLGHPQVCLKAITVTPGTPEQIGLIRHAVTVWFGRDIPIGSYNIHSTKACVSSWHHKAYGVVQPSDDAFDGAELLLRYCDEETTLITGAPLKNLGKCLMLVQERNLTDFRLGRLVAQGGFAGEGVVPPEKQLEKFKGQRLCGTFNLNGAPKEALAAQSSPFILKKMFVAKNVCHQVLYDQRIHQYFAQAREKSLSHALIWKGMEVYLRRKPAGKLLHDPLAACCAIDESIGEWTEVELYRENGQWGSALSPGSGTWIITDYDRNKFMEVLTAY